MLKEFEFLLYAILVLDN